MIEIFGVPASRARRVLWVAEECNADYTLTKIAPRSPESRSPEYRKINPNGRVPAMRDGAFPAPQIAGPGVIGCRKPEQVA